MNSLTWSSSSPYIIDSSHTEDLAIAARHELLTHVRPLVSPSRIGGTTYAMERYVCHLIKEVVAMSGVGFIQFTNEGCLADSLYSLQPMDLMCMGLQVKVTSSSSIKVDKRCPNSPRKIWSFKFINKNYQGLLLVLRSITDGKTWLIPHGLLRTHYVGKNLYIYDDLKHEPKFDMRQFEVTDEQIAPKLYEYFTVIASSPWFKPISLSHALIPISLSHQKEQQGRQKLLALFGQVGLRTRPPDIENGPYDFWVGELKVQDKWAQLERKQHTGLHVHMYRRRQGGRIHPYSRNEFNFVAIHLPGIYENFFYLIPMGALIAHQIVTMVDQPGKASIMVYPPGVREIHNRKQANKWANEFLLHYNDPEIATKILHLYITEQLREHGSTPPQLKLNNSSSEVG
jgi:hypothetical protein